MFKKTWYKKKFVRDSLASNPSFPECATGLRYKSFAHRYREKMLRTSHERFNKNRADARGSLQDALSLSFKVLHVRLAIGILHII